MLVLVQFGTHARVVAQDVAKLQGLADGDIQFVDIKGFGYVVVGTVPHGLHGIFYRAVGRHYDHWHMGVTQLDLGQ